MKEKIMALLMAATAAAHEEENALLQGFVHSLGLTEEQFIVGGTAVVLLLYLLWQRA